MTDSSCDKCNGHGIVYSDEPNPVMKYCPKCNRPEGSGE